MANPYQGDDDDYFAAARDKEGNVKQTGLARTAKLSPFGLAFDTARKAGEKTFTFRGKKYSTDMGGAKKAPSKPAAAPSKPAAADTPKASALRPGAKAVVEKNPGDFDRMMAERRAERDAKKRDSDRGGEMSDVIGAKKGGMMKAYKSGGMVKSSASRRADGCATKGKTKGRMR